MGYTVASMQPEKIVWKDIATNLAVLAIAIGSIYVALKVWGPDDIRSWIEGSGAWAPLVLIGAKASTIVFAPLSGAFLYPLAGGLFGFSKALILLAVGDALGGTIAFAISRRFGRKAVERLIGGEQTLLSRILETIGTIRGFFITRLLLITAQDILAYAAGLSRLSYVPFILIHSAIGLIPTIILTLLGSSLFTDPSLGSLGLLFGATSAVGAVSALLFAWYITRGTDPR